MKTATERLITGMCHGDELRRWSMLGQYGPAELRAGGTVDSCDPLAGATADTTATV